MTIDDRLHGSRKKNQVLIQLPSMAYCFGNMNQKTIGDGQNRKHLRKKYDSALWSDVGLSRTGNIQYYDSMTKKKKKTKSKESRSNPSQFAG